MLTGGGGESSTEAGTHFNGSTPIKEDMQILLPAGFSTIILA